MLQLNHTQSKKVLPFAYFRSLAAIFNSCPLYEGKLCRLHYEGQEINFLHSCPLHLLFNINIYIFHIILSYLLPNLFQFFLERNHSTSVITFPWPFLLYFPFFKKDKHKLYTVLKMQYTTHLSNGLIIFCILLSFHFLTILIKLYAPFDHCWAFNWCFNSTSYSNFKISLLRGNS